MFGLTRVTIVLINGSDRIILESDIGNFKELVSFLKDKLGRKFDLSKLPIGYRPLLVKYDDIDSNKY